MTPGALDGVLVADFSRVLAGPYATMLLGDLGAEVIKVERPGQGDDTRAWGPPWDAEGRATYFLGVNRNKRSIALDLKDPDDQRLAIQLAARADVVVENFAPGTLSRAGLGYDQVRATNPGVIYASITGFGAGEGAALPGYDLLVQGMGGLMSVTGPAPGQPTKVGVALVDVVTGLHAAVGILAALRHREVTGEGQRVEVNLLSSVLSAMVNQASGYVAGGVVPDILGNRHPSIAPYETIRAADGALILAVGNDDQFRRLVGCLGRPELADDPSFATNPSRVEHRDRLIAELEAGLSDRTAADWIQRLTAVGVPCGPINDVGQAIALAESLGLAPVVDSGGTPTVANPVGLGATPACYRRPPPGLDADGVEVRRELG
jgi:crotonobetainyl-CoA:carnitine CoA-transferase CaiB-like acyl-CoA transferase